MTDICLSFPDKATADSVLYTTVDQVTDVDGVVVVETSVTPNYKNIDIIDTVYVPSTDAGLPPVALPGYAVNVFAMPDEDTSALTPYIVTPTVRYRVWA